MAWVRSNKKSSGAGGAFISLETWDKRVISSIGSLTYTFSEAGTYQFYVFWTRSTASAASSDINIQLNGNSVTSTFYDGSEHGYLYGEITVAANDIITISNTITDSNRAVEYAIVKNANLSNFSEIGYESNNNTPINYISSNFPLIEFLITPNSINTSDVKIYEYCVKSFAIPRSNSTYYYAKITAIKL